MNSSKNGPSHRQEAGGYNTLPFIFKGLEHIVVTTRGNHFFVYNAIDKSKEFEFKLPQTVKDAVKIRGTDNLITVGDDGCILMWDISYLTKD